MRTLIVTGGLMCGAVLGLTPVAAAQIGYLWTYDELLQKAHVVVIAKCVATRDTGGRLSHPELLPDLPLVEMHTTFRVEAVLKATRQDAPRVGTELLLRRFRLDRERWAREHPPEPGMPPPALLGGVGSPTLLEERSYLLFLTKPVDGPYEPLSGFTYPADSMMLLDKSFRN